MGFVCLCLLWEAGAVSCELADECKAAAQHPGASCELNAVLLYTYRLDSTVLFCFQLRISDLHFWGEEQIVFIGIRQILTNSASILRFKKEKLPLLVCVFFSK